MNSIGRVLEGLVKQSLIVMFNTVPDGNEMGRDNLTFLLYVSYVQFNIVGIPMRFILQLKLLPGTNLPLIGNVN